MDGKTALKLFSGVMACVIFANLVYLDTIAIQSRATQSSQMAVTPTPGPSQLLLTGTPTPIPSPTPAILTATPVVKTQTIITAPTVKEYFVPFGTGTSSAADWQDVAGLQTTIDNTSYPNIKNIIFEVTLHNAASSQNVSVRLYNATDNHPVWYSDVAFDAGNTGTFLVSKSVSLDSGSKVYKVQAKTQLQAPVVIDQSRLHITLN